MSLSSCHNQMGMDRAAETCSWPSVPQHDEQSCAQCHVWLLPGSDHLPMHSWQHQLLHMHVPVEGMHAVCVCDEMLLRTWRHDVDAASHAGPKSSRASQQCSLKPLWLITKCIASLGMHARVGRVSIVRLHPHASAIRQMLDRGWHIGEHQQRGQSLCCSCTRCSISWLDCSCSCTCLSRNIVSMISNRGDQLYTDARCSSSLSCGVMPVIFMEPLLMACDAFNAWRVHMSVQSLVSRLAHNPITCSLIKS